MKRRMCHMYWRAVDLACCSVSYQWTELISRNSRLFQVQWHCTTITYSMIMGIASKLVCGWGWKSYLVGVSLSMCVANISVSLGLSRFLAFRCCFVCSAPVDTREPFIQWWSFDVGYSFAVGWGKTTDGWMGSAWRCCCFIALDRSSQQSCLYDCRGRESIISDQAPYLPTCNL